MKWLKAIAVFLSIIIIYTFFYLENEKEAYFPPIAIREDLISILQNKPLTEEDYKTLFCQTGLGRVAIDDIMQESDGIQRISEFQNSFLKKQNVKCESLVPFLTNQETISESFPLAPYKNGYIFITKSTHTSIFRHGHCAIVSDEKKGKTLESLMIGTDSQTQDINYWKSYSTFIMMKPKNTDDKKLNEISTYANNNLNGISYGILTGLFEKFASVDKLKSTQCSHLVWYSYKNFGYDMDSDGGWLVTAKDIVNSPLLEVVQIYGLNPDNIWK